IFTCTTTAPPTTSPLSLHDALPISQHYANSDASSTDVLAPNDTGTFAIDPTGDPAYTGVLATGEAAYPIDLKPGSVDFGNQLVRSEEHTSELQSPCNFVCRLLLEKK